jgi:hypothetical protein
MKLHTIVFAEPSTFSGVKPNSCFFVIDDTMYEQLLKEPKEFFSQEKEADNLVYQNAYCFGELYPLNEYNFYGYHDNDGGQTGFVNYHLYEAGKFIDYSTDIPDEPQIFYSSYDYKLVEEAREKYPSILFCGDTIGGDVGANLYVHYDKYNKIDSLIIDNEYFFNDESEPKFRL